MRSGTPVKVKKLGHVVFTVSDVERTTVALVPAEAPHEPPARGNPVFITALWRSVPSPIRCPE